MIERGKTIRWFGAGAAVSAALVVVVYEGGVRVANAEGRGEIAVAAGEAAAVGADGTVSEIDLAPQVIARAAEGNGAGAGSGLGRSGTDAVGLRAEVGRLRGILERNAISPQTGMPVVGADGEPRRRGLADDGDTDLTEEEWRTLAERGELRYRIPGGAEGSIRPEVAEAHQLSADEVTRLDEIIRDAHARLRREVGLLYREAVGADPGGMSLSGMMSEIEDKTDARETLRVRWVLAQERGGLAVAPPISAEMVPYERMLRLLINFEGELEVALCAVVPPEVAHRLLHGDPSMPAHAYGTMGRPPRSN